MRDEIQRVKRTAKAQFLLDAASSWFLSSA